VGKAAEAVGKGELDDAGSIVGRAVGSAAGRAVGRPAGSEEGADG
jgi:hypothetical protein